jgi:hypothetical protein
MIIASFASIQVSVAEEVNPPQSFLQAINWEIKYLEPNTDQNQSSEGTFGLAYDVDYDFMKKTDKRIAFIGKGLIAADKDANPKDFLESEIEIGIEQDWKISNPYDVACPDGTEKIECDALNKAGKAHKNIASATFNLDASYKSNQDFSQNQYAYGANLTFKYRGYAKINYIFDAPFMLTRWLAGHSLSKNSGIRRTYPGVLPSIKVALEQVDPKNNDVRKAVLGNEDSFSRWNVDIGMTTPMAKINGKSINFNFVWRYFQELDADDAICDAGLDQFSYSSIAFVYDGKVYVSYSSGELPLANKDDEVFELGWKFNFGEVNDIQSMERVNR